MNVHELQQKLGYYFPNWHKTMEEINKGDLRSLKEGVKKMPLNFCKELLDFDKSYFTRKGITFWETNLTKELNLRFSKVKSTKLGKLFYESDL